MVSPFLSVALWVSCIVYVAALVTSIPWAVRRVRVLEPPQRIAGVAALLMLLGVQVWFPRGGSESAGLSSLQSQFQVLCLFAAGILLAWVLASYPMRRPREWLAVACLALYAIVGIISAMSAPAFLLSLYKAGILFLDVALFFALACYRDRAPDPLLLLRIVLMTIASLVVLAGANVVFAPETSLARNYGALGVWLRPQFPVQHPNTLGYLAAVTIIFSWVQLLSDRSLARFAIYGPQLTAGMIVCFLAQSRTSLLGLTLVAAIGTLISPNRLRWTLIGSVCASIILACLAVWQPSTVEQHLDQLYAYIRRGTTDEQWATMSGRTILFEDGWRMVHDAPLFGHGFAAAAQLSENYDLLATNLHNSHMEVLVNTGVIGYLAWLGFLSIGYASFVMRTRQVRGGQLGSRADLPFLRMVLMILILTFIKSFASTTLVQHQLGLMLLLSIVTYNSLIGHRDRSGDDPWPHREPRPLSQVVRRPA